MKPVKQAARVIVTPLDPDALLPHRKARVAELHALWCAAGFSVPVYQLLLDERRGARATEHRGVSNPTRGTK